MTPTINRCFNRHKKDYAEVSPMPERFDDLVRDLAPMQRTQPNYSSDDLASITLPVVIALGEGDEFTKREHAEYLARAIPHAESLILNGVSLFAPVQRPNVFNNAMLAFLGAFCVQVPASPRLDRHLFCWRSPFEKLSQYFAAFVEITSSCTSHL
jgi:hypothetical protein